jgi:cytochrome P450
MSLILNLLHAVELEAHMVGEGALAGAQLAAKLASASGDAKARLAAVLGDPAGQRALFASLRAFSPNLAIDRSLITSYPCEGTVIVSRAEDVREVLDRQDDFEVVYEPKMRKITGGANFFLGMQDGDDYKRDTSAMRLAARREDVANIVVPLARAEARRIVGAFPNDIDLPQALTTVVPAMMVQHYFGVDTASVEELTEWATAMFWYLFVDLQGDPAVEKRALDGAAKCLKAIEAAIAKIEREPDERVTVLSRAIALRNAGTQGFDGTAVRDNMIGLVIGAIPTISKASVQALDGLLDRPDDLAEAQAAAARGDEAAVGRSLFEALRFNPVNPVIYRRATRDCTIAEGELRACHIKKGAMVLASNLSAMFDPAVVEHPDSFRTDRPWDIYMLWGYGLHRCFGDAINQAIIPALLTPLLAGAPLTRAPGAAGHPDKATPFPQHFTVNR